MKRALPIAVIGVMLGAAAGAQKVTLPRAKEALTLVDFGDPQALGRWTGLKCEPVTVAGKPGMKFMFPKWAPGSGEWPMVSLLYDGGRGYPVKDWSHYGRIAFDLGVEGDQPGDVALELRDTAGQNGWTEHIPVEPGHANHIEVSLAEVATEVKVEHIEEIIFFTTRPARDYAITVANLQLLPGEKPPLAEFDLVYPNYRGLIFPDVDRLSLTTTLHAEEYGTPLRDLTVVLSCRIGGKEVSGRRAVGRENVDLSLPTPGLPSGPGEVSVAVVGPGGERPVQRRWPVRKLTPAEVRGLKVTIDAHNNTIVDGKPFFPLGWYGGGNEGQVAEIADSPFNCILDYGTDHKPKAEMLKYLDLLQQKRLKLIYCLNDVYPTATYLADKGWEGLKDNQAIADAVVQAYRGHPAILAWYLNDELPERLVPKLEGYYQRVKELDPNHPCYIVLCNMSELGAFTDTTDVLGVDPYPIPQSPVTRVNEWMESANAATQGHRPTWLVPQAFAWYQYQPEGSNRGRIPTEAELKSGRAPTYEEERCMTYLALAHGAKGLIYYCYYDLRVLPQYLEMWGWMKRIAAEVKALSPVLLSPEDLGPARLAPTTGPVHTKLKRAGGRLYLIAVNAGREPCQVTFELPSKPPAQVEVMFEGRTAPTQGMKLAADFKPLEVHVYDLGSGR